jgi:hypothetical protein
MKFEDLVTKIIVLILSLMVSSCGFVPKSVNPLSKKDSPDLYPIIQVTHVSGSQNAKFGYINTKGDIVIQPQFAQAWFFSEELAVACLEHNKCGYIDQEGKFVINPQFESAFRFSEGLAAVVVGKKLGFVDKTGKYAINPQFDFDGGLFFATSLFSEGLAQVKMGGKFGFVDKEGKIVINPQFERAFPFMEGLSAVNVGGKWGFIDKQGKIVINPQFDSAQPFVNGLAGVKVGAQWGFIDKEGKIVINPQFDIAAPFAAEGVSLVALQKKAGYIDKNGKYIVNPQYAVPDSVTLNEDIINWVFFITSDLGRISFSEGLALVRVGEGGIFESNSKARFGYADQTGKIVINPQFILALPFYGELALVYLAGESGWASAEISWINKEGKIVWKMQNETPKDNSNTNTPVSNTAINVPNFSVNSPKPTSTSSTVSNSTETSKTGRLATDMNIRSEPNKDAASLGIHFKDAKLKVIDMTSYQVGDEVSIWYKVRITEYGCSKDSNLGCGKNSPNDADEGWMNAKYIILD